MTRPKVGDQIQIIGTGSNGLEHGLQIGSFGEITNDGTGETFRIEGISVNGRPLKQWVNLHDLKPAQTAEEIRREFLELIGVET